VLRAGAGNESIYAVRGGRDRVYCRDGRDVACKDRVDVARGCEARRWVPSALARRITDLSVPHGRGQWLWTGRWDYARRAHRLYVRVTRSRLPVLVSATTLMVTCRFDSPRTSN
jgi:hypothetical protein